MTEKPPNDDLRERLSVNLEWLASYLLDGCGLTAIFVITFAAAAILVFWSSPPVVRDPREFLGKIVDKRISAYESEQGSSFSNDLIIEEKNGRRFRFSVTEEMYGRAKIGMWIRRNNKGTELLTDVEPNATSP
jgi:hypothetical protein